MHCSLVSKAHDWVQILPLEDKVLRCTRCGMEISIGKWSKQRCIDHLENPRSGFLPE